MTIDWDPITHVTKVDPAKELPSDLEVLEGTDLILVGGSDGVTETNTLEAIRAIDEHLPSVPVCQEPNGSSHVSREIDAVDALAVPAVYNGDRDHFVGKHVDLFTEIGRKPEKPSARVCQSWATSSRRKASTWSPNSPRSCSARVRRPEPRVRGGRSRRRRVDVDPDQVAGTALATETFYRFPIFYVEYSGTYGGPADVEAASRYLEETTLLYGGGIDSAKKATEILEAGADAIVVGDCFHDDPETFRETIPSR